MKGPKAIFTILFLTLGLRVHAFTLNNNVSASFDKDEVLINVAAHTCSNIGITNEKLLDLAVEAVDQFWNRAPNTDLTLSRGSIKTVSSAFQTDNVCETSNTTSCTPTDALKVDSDILISCNTDTATNNNFESEDSVLAVTVPNNISGATINGALILINDRTNTSFNGRSDKEIRSILAHEIGHALGLGHSPVDDSLMHFLSISTRDYLGQDDVDGVGFLYPAGQPISACGSIAFLNNDSKGPPTNGPFLPFVISAFLGLLVWGILSKTKSLTKSYWQES
jgi:hypothetical protein